MYVISEREDGSWQIKKKGSKRASKICNSKAEAIAYCNARGYEFIVDVKIGSTELNINSKKVKKYWKPIVIILALFLILIGIVFVLDYTKVINIGIINRINNLINTGKNENDDDSSNSSTIISGSDFSIHFLELGNKYTGDSTYIKAGDIDILIDAGSRKDSADAIANYISNYVTDGKLEYVIATHAHQDHIAGFVSTNDRPSIFKRFAVDTLIDFALTNTTSQIYADYLDEVSELVADGTTHYSADMLFGDQKEHSNIFELGDGTTMTILEQTYYYNESSDENNYSVCTLFTNGGNNYLLTGDLEEDGEKSLVKMNPNLPECVLFKAGHHGSKTSSNEELLEKIKPEIVCVCCCAGSEEYTDYNDNTFPTQAFINRVAKYTDKIYVTTRCLNYDEGLFESMNGTIVVSSTKNSINTDGTYKVEVNCSNNNTILKDTDWFNEIIYVDSSGKFVDEDGNYYTASDKGVVGVPRRIWPN